MGGDRRLDEFTGLLVVGDVAEVGDGPAAGRADLGGDLLGGCGGRLAGAVAAGLPVVVDDDGRAEPGQFEGFGAAEAAARAGDDRGQPVQRRGSDITVLGFLGCGGVQSSMQVRSASPVRIWSRASLIPSSRTRWVIIDSRSMRPARQSAMARS
ncbi:hypothetical protein GA0115255_125322 [Streptomyces sp. Ncost-T6T-2b]|nr:hypothetical protein GA0115255_125322 [Streptomyces sp. Ncost-T6T-2b]